MATRKKGSQMKTVFVEDAFVRRDAMALNIAYSSHSTELKSGDNMVIESNEKEAVHIRLNGGVKKESRGIYRFSGRISAIYPLGSSLGIDGVHDVEVLYVMGREPRVEITNID